MQIVLGDRSEQKAFKYTGITCFNPGSFSSDSTFVAYRPCTQEVEFSALWVADKSSIFYIFQIENMNFI